MKKRDDTFAHPVFFNLLIVSICLAVAAGAGYDSTTCSRQSYLLGPRQKVIAFTYFKPKAVAGGGEGHHGDNSLVWGSGAPLVFEIEGLPKAKDFSHSLMAAEGF